MLYRLFRTIFTALTVGVAALAVSACEDIPTPTVEGPAPILVTLPASTPAPPTPTGAVFTPTPFPTQSIPPTPAPQSEGIGSTHLLWEWAETAHPSALAVTPSKLAAIVADGRFAWLDANTGHVEATAYLWKGLLQGDSWGEVYTDGILALLAIREESINPKTGLADSRARLAVYDGQARELWSLPELGSQHFYSAAMASGPGIVIVGKWPHGFDDNELAAYELFTGKRLWHVTEKDTGYQQVLLDGDRVYALITNPDGGGVAAYDLRTGDKLWAWADPAVRQADQIVLGENALFVLSVAETVALDPISGKELWGVGFNAAPDAGLGAHGGLIYLAPAPSAQTSFRPGIVGINAANGQLAWHTLGGLVADPLSVGTGALWVIVKDYDGGQVYLSGLEADTGLERVRIPVSRDVQSIYHLVAMDTRVYVLGETLLAFGY